ncbi:hypothetical protein QUF72_09785 [Desulfobacterales bacterium HSG2]|nr:hypothetical protein [Desulfobacterales bacterium HSG2]
MTAGRLTAALVVIPANAGIPASAGMTAGPLTAALAVIPANAGIH